MEPRIQYAKTADGVSIAFWTLGEGEPLVWVPGGVVSNMWGDWQIPWAREWDELLAARWKFVKFDRRGNGHSQRDTANFSLDALVLDLEAVVDHLALEKFALDAGMAGGPVAITYAARHPEKVSHLFLWNSYARGADFWRSPRLEALRALAEADWDTYIEAAAHLYYPDPVAGAALLREGATPEAQRAFADAASRHDVTEVLSQVRCPTLLVRALGPFVVSEKLVGELASRIPGASLVVADFADRLAMLRIIDEFLGEGEPTTATAGAPAQGSFRTVLFTDLVGHTEMMSRLGDKRGREVLREHERITRDVLKAHGGAEVKTMGDGFMASFGSVTKAVECAVALQRAMAALTPDPSPVTGEGQHVEPLKVRCGLNAGEPIEEEGDLFGATVILAARIAARAEGGEILVADTVRGLCTGKGFLFADRGEFVAKGFEEPVRVYEVRWGEQ